MRCASFAQPASRPKSSSKKARGPAGRRPAWTASRRPSREDLLGHVYSTAPAEFKTIIAVFKHTPDMDIGSRC